MTHDEEQALLAKAAQPSIERIREDAAATSDVVIKEVLEHLAARLLDPKLRAEQWLRECGVFVGSFLVNFHSQVGQPPGFYLWDLRLEIAARLLGTTNLSKRVIAGLIGYSGNQAFNKAFQRWSGVQSTLFRKKMRKVNEKIGSPSEDFHSTRFLRKVLRASLDPAQAAELYGRLHKLSAVSHRRRQPERTDLTGIDDKELERLAARDLWNEIKDREFSDQRLLVRCQLHFTTTALFDFLREKSVEESRKDRSRGVEFAQLALESLEICAGELGADLANRRAQGWVYLGSAYCLASDFLAAEEGFARAQFECRCAGDHREPLVEAELTRKTAMLRWYQRRYAEALDLVDSAIVMLRHADETVALARSQILKACIRRDVGDFRGAIADFETGIELIDEQDQPFLCFSGQAGLALACALAGNSEGAEAWLVKSDRLCRMLNNDLATHQLKWTAGLVEYTKGNTCGAGRMLAEARGGLQALEEIGYTSVVTLDLAMLYSEEGRMEDAMQLATDVLPMLQALNFRGEVLAAVQVLHAALGREELPLSVLQQVRTLVSGNGSVIGV